MKALKMAMDKSEITTMPAEEPTNMLMMLPTINTITPTINHLPKPEMSRLMTEDKLAIAKKTPAVPPKAVITNSAPFLKPKTMAIMRESISPMKKVKPVRHTHRLKNV